MTWMQTHTGMRFGFINPDPADVRAEDIAHGLSMKCRFGGHVKHTDHFYTVAQHCILTSSIVPKKAKLWALLHDAPEGYLSDIISPLKAELPDYKIFEDVLSEAINRRFGCILTDEIIEAVDEADNFMLFYEARRLLANTKLIETWDVVEMKSYDYITPAVLGDRLFVLPRADAKQSYLTLLKQYSMEAMWGAGN